MIGMPNWNSVRRALIADARKLSLGGYLLIASLLALLVGAIVFAILAWSFDTDVPVFGYVAMAAGVIFSLALGVGLMTLCFCSSRFGYDEPTNILPSRNHEHSPEV